MRSLCELCNPARYVDPEWLECHRALEAYSVDKHVFWHTNGGQVNRKGWEWTQCIYGLEKLGALRDSAAGLGVGAGREPLIFYLGDRIQKVVALDLYGNELWSHGPGGQEANADVTVNPQRWCTKKMDLSRISFVYGSGTEINYGEAKFDFCWSLSSIEHFGDHEAARKAMQEMARVTKPAGIVAIATEYLLLPEYGHVEYFNRAELQRFIIDASEQLELISDIDWAIPPPEYLIDSIVVPAGVDRRRRHVVLNDGDVQWTSIMLFFRRH
jgi:SAM-dependent methyltransferase